MLHPIGNWCQIVMCYILLVTGVNLWYATSYWWLVSTCDMLHLTDDWCQIVICYILWICYRFCIQLVAEIHFWQDTGGWSPPVKCYPWLESICDMLLVVHVYHLVGVHLLSYLLYSLFLDFSLLMTRLQNIDRNTLLACPRENIPYPLQK